MEDNQYNIGKLKLISADTLKSDPEFVKLIKEIITEHDKSVFTDNYIDLIYSNDEYGKEARKLGLIKHAYEGDAGIDLPTVLLHEDREHGKMIYPGDRTMLHTGIHVAFPKGYWGRIIHRSSTEKRSRLRVIEGVIDDFRGPLLVQVHNMNSFPITVHHGQRIAQLIVVKTASFKCREVEHLPPSQRGSNGWGSTG